MKRPTLLLCILIVLLSVSCSPSGDSSSGESPQSPSTVFHVVYLGNGNDSGTVPVDSREYHEGAIVTVAGNTGNLGRKGFSFAGWNAQADGGGTSYAPGTSIEIRTSDVTLFCVWTQNTPTETVSPAGEGPTPITPPTEPPTVPPTEPVSPTGGGTVSIKTPAVITVSISAPFSIASGSDLTATSTVSSSVDSYTWYIDGIKVPGQTANSFVGGADMLNGPHTLMVVVDKDGILYSASYGFVVR